MKYSNFFFEMNWKIFYIIYTTKYIVDLVRNLPSLLHKYEVFVGIGQGLLIGPS